MVEQPEAEKHVEANVLELLKESYKEVLDATKHQDDKIGRLFTGVSFLTAAALATANLGGSKYLSQRYAEFNAPIGILSLGGYLILVVLCVMLLINSLATPLRVPGLARNPANSFVGYVGEPPIVASQIYFGEIAKLGLKEWERKWKSEEADLKRELAQSLVKETHNLAVRTQFKYGRTTEAITVFNFALLFLSLTVVFCVSSALGSSDLIPTPRRGRWAAAAMFGLFFFVQLQGQIRYARQTVDELAGVENVRGAIYKYIWVLAATAWIILLASGYSSTGYPHMFLFLLMIIGALALLRGTVAFSAARRDLGKPTPWVAWFGSIVASVAGLVVTILVGLNIAYEYAFAGAVGASTLLAMFSLSLPSLGLHRNRKEFTARTAGGAQ